MDSFPTDRRPAAQRPAPVPNLAHAGRDPAAAAAVADPLLPSVDARGDRRYDLYVGIHKALRAFMADMLRRVGAFDPHDDADRAAVLGDLRELLRLCEVHVDDENRFVQAAIEARRPGACGRIAAEHVEHLAHIGDLFALADAVDAARGGDRADAAARLYRAFATFVAENLTHMLFEEIHHNAALWAACRDDEIAAVEGALVASLPPEALRVSGYWMLRAFNPAERARFLDEARRHAPPEAFQMMMGLAREALPVRELRKLEQALGLAPAIAAAA